MYKKILVPFDFGNSFVNVPEQLQKLSGSSKEAKITVFNVIAENEMADNVKFLYIFHFQLYSFIYHLFHNHIHILFHLYNHFYHLIFHIHGKL